MIDDLPKIIATAQRLAAQMGGQFVVDRAKLADFKRYREGQTYEKG